MKKIQQRRGATVGCAAVIAALSGCVKYSDGGYGSHSGSYGNPSSTTPYADGRPANANSNGAYVDSYEDEEGSTHGSTYYEAEAERRAYEDAERRAALRAIVGGTVRGSQTYWQNAPQIQPLYMPPQTPITVQQSQTTECKPHFNGYTTSVRCVTRNGY